MVPLGRGEAAAAAVAGSRGGKRRNQTRPGLGNSRGARDLGSLLKHFPVETPVRSPQGPHPSSVSMGMGIQPPFLFPWRPGPCPSSPGLEPPSLSSDFSVYPGLGAIPHRFLFPASFQGALFVLIFCHPQTAWSFLFRTVGLRVAASGAWAVQWGPRCSPLSSLFSQMRGNVHLLGCVSQSKGSGRFLPDLNPWPASGNYLSIQPPHYVHKGSLSNPEQKRKIKRKAKLKTQSDEVVIFKFSICPSNSYLQNLCVCR